MATHSSILTWRIPWTEEPGGLLSMGLQRVGHDWATKTHSLDFFGQLYNFPHIDLEHNLLDLYLSISLRGVLMWILKFISNFTCSLLVYRKVIYFCILTLYPENLLYRQGDFVVSSRFSAWTVIMSLDRRYFLFLLLNQYLFCLFLKFCCSSWNLKMMFRRSCSSS